MFRIVIDDCEVNVENLKTILEASLEMGIYIPHLCFHPGLGTSRSLKAGKSIYQGEQEIAGNSEFARKGCGLCVIEIEGKDELCHACTMPVEDGIIIHTDTEAVTEQRKGNLVKIMGQHPHACITCRLADGCDRKLCSQGIPEEQRCCWKFHQCELRKIASFIGLEENRGGNFRNISRLDDNPLFSMAASLCVSCLRCVMACRDISGREALSFVSKGEEIVVGTCRSNLKESGCKFCLACVEVCPTGALREKDPKKSKTKIRLEIPSAIWPPEKDELRSLSKSNLMEVSDKEGVFKLYDKDRKIVQITGCANLKEALVEESERANVLLYFNYEENEMFMMRERQLIQQYMEKHGEMPPNNREIDDLF